MRRRDLLTLALPTGLVLLTAPLSALGAEEKGGKKKKSGGENYLPIDPIIGTTTRGGGKRGVLSVDCGLQIDDGKLREYAEASLPRLRAAYAQAIQTYAAGLTPGAEPNVEFIIQALQRQTDIVLKKRGAKLLIGAVVVN